MLMLKLKQIILYGLLIFFLSHAAHAATYYVSPYGSDNNLGTLNKPFKSLSHVARKVQPGDTVIALDGIYYDTDQGKNEAILYIRKGGTSDKKIVFKALNPGKVVLDGKNKVKYGIYIAPGAAQITIDGFEIKRCWHFGISIAGDYITVKKNNIHDNGLTCPADYPYGEGGIYTDKQASHITIDSNKVYHNGRLYLHKGDHKNDNEDHGIYICSSHSLIINNLIYDNQAFGIQIAGYGILTDVVISNNTILNEQNRGGIIVWNRGAKDCIIQNNIIFNNNGYAVSFLKDGGHHIVRNNILFNNSDGEILEFMTSANNIYENKITNPMLDESFIPVAGSPAINAGYSNDAPSHDINGLIRNNNDGVDIGCYEHISSDSTIEPPSGLRVLNMSF